MTAKAFLKESKTTKTNFIPEKHFKKVFANDQKKLTKITALLRKNNLTLIEKDDLLWETFLVLKEENRLDKIVAK